MFFDPEILLLFPLIGFIVNFLLIPKIDSTYSGFLGTGTFLLSFISATGCFLKLINSQKPIRFFYYSWLELKLFKVDIALNFDRLSGLLILFITASALIISAYSLLYMKKSPGSPARFFSLMNIYVFFTLIVIMADNLVLMFLGWQGITICGALFAGYNQKGKENSINLAKFFIPNWLGDLAILAASLICAINFNTLEFNLINQKMSLPVNSAISGKIDIIALLFLAGISVKSFLFPFYQTATASSKAPIPYLAFSQGFSGCVTGVYLICRLSYLFAESSVTMRAMAIIGIISGIGAMLPACRETNIPKLLSFSTISQCGVIFIALGNGIFTGAIFHALTHAFTKGLLFLGAGIIITNMKSNNLLGLGRLKKEFPFTWLTLFIAICSLSGFPFTGGFFSYHYILQSILETKSSGWHYFLGSLILSGTAFYIFRFYFLVFYNSRSNEIKDPQEKRELHTGILVPLVVMAFFTGISGFTGIGRPFQEIIPFTNLIEKYFSNFFYQSPVTAYDNIEYWNSFIYFGFSIAACAMGAFWAKFYYFKRTSYPAETEQFIYGISCLVKNEYYLDRIYFYLIVLPIKLISAVFLKAINDGIFPGFFYLIEDVLKKIGFLLQRLQNLNANVYTMAFFSSAIFIMIWLS